MAEQWRTDDMPNTAINGKFDKLILLQAIDAIPMVSLQIRILRVWGMLFERNWRPYIITLIVSLLNISMIAYSIKTDDPIDAVMRNSFMLVLWINTQVRIVNMIMKMEKIEQLMAIFVNLYKHIAESKQTEWLEMLRKTDRFAARLAKSNVVAGLMTIGTALLTTLLSSQRVLVYGNYIPGVNILQTPYYEVLYVYHTIISPIGCLTYIPFSSLVVSLALFGILMCRGLQLQLRSIKKESADKNTSGQLIYCVKYQLVIISFINRLNDLITYVFLAEFALFGMLICVLLLLLNIAQDFGHLLIALVQISMVFMQICTLYWFANELSDATAAIADAAYDTNWLDFPKSSQKIILLLILRAQKPTTLTVGNVYPMSMEMFQSLVNASYSYYTLLRRFSD